MIAGEYNIAARSGRRLYRRFGFGPESNPVNLDGGVFTGAVADAAGAIALVLDDYLTLSDDKFWVILDVPAEDYDDAISESGPWELTGDLGGGPETYLYGVLVHNISLVP